MMGDHSNEETEYPTSVVDDRDEILVVPTLPPLPTEEEQDSWRGYLVIFVVVFFLGGAYFFWRRWLFECTWCGGVVSSGTSSHIQTRTRRTPGCLFLQDLEYVSYYSFSTLSSDENSSHVFGKREKARRKEQLERELKVKVRATLLLVVGSFLLFAFFDSHFLPGMVEMGLVRT
jgi:hypothetical protein